MLRDDTFMVWPIDRAEEDDLVEYTDPETKQTKRFVVAVVHRMVNGKAILMDEETRTYSTDHCTIIEKRKVTYAQTSGVP